MKASTIVTAVLSGAAVVAADDFPPKPNHNNNSCCKVYYKTKPGDTCDSIVAAHAPGAFHDFYSNNMVVDKYCSNLKIGEWYCICKFSAERSEGTSHTGRQLTQTRREEVRRRARLHVGIRI